VLFRSTITGAGWDALSAQRYERDMRLAEEREAAIKQALSAMLVG